MGFPVPGGSVLVSCRLDDRDAQGGLIAHGYLREYHLNTELIHAHLRAMWEAGQRRLAFAVPFFSGGDTFALDARGGIMGDARS